MTPPKRRRIWKVDSYTNGELRVVPPWKGPPGLMERLDCAKWVALLLDGLTPEECFLTKPTPARRRK